MEKLNTTERCSTFDQTFSRCHRKKEPERHRWTDRSKKRPQRRKSFQETNEGDEWTGEWQCDASLMFMLLMKPVSCQHVSTACFSHITFQFLKTYGPAQESLIYLHQSFFTISITNYKCTDFWLAMSTSCYYSVSSALIVLRSFSR